MRKIAEGLEVSKVADKNGKHKIVLLNQAGKKIVEARGTAEEVEMLKAMKTNEERAVVMKMKELIENKEKPGLAGLEARVMYNIKNSKFVQNLEGFWKKHGSKVKTAL